MTCLMLSMMMVTSAHAATCRQQIQQISGLDNLTKQSMIVDCESTKLASQEAAATPVITTGERIEMAEKWAEVAKQFVGAMSLVAQEMGKTVNEFLPTPAGILTATLITWQVMGDDIMTGLSNVIQACVSIIFMLIVARYTKNLRHSETKEVEVTNWFGTKIKKVKVYTPVAKLSCNETEWYHAVYIIGTVVGLALLYFSF